MKCVFYAPILGLFLLTQTIFANSKHGLIPLSLKPNVQSFVFDTGIVVVDQKNFKADISYLFIDFKYNHGIKICEFGRAKTAGLGDMPCDMFVNGKMETIFTPYWSYFWQYLSQFDMPVWFVGIKPADHKNEFLNKTESNEAWDSFVAMGGHYFPKISALEADPFFVTLKNTKLSDPSRINAHQGIIIYKKSISEPLERFGEFKKRYPQFIYLDDVGNIYGAYKDKGAALFQSPELQEYKPRWGVYDKKYTEDLAQRIINDVKSDMFVIKPLDGGYGRGVIVVDKQELDQTLRLVCGESSSIRVLSGVYESQSHTYSHWKRDKNKSFIVEEYSSTQPMFIHDKFYDPTIRVYFVLMHDQGKLHVTIMGGYAKIPPKALSDNCSLSEKHKTTPYYKSDVSLSALTLPENVFNDIKREMKVMLPKIYRRMLENHR